MAICCKPCLVCKECCEMSDGHSGPCLCRSGHVPVPRALPTFYAIADRKDLSRARWYRTYSRYNYSGFVGDLDEATTWLKRGKAQGKCMALGGSAVLVEFTVAAVNIVDQTEHLKKVAEKKRLKIEREAALAERELAAAELALKAAQEKIDRLKGNRAHPKFCGCKSCVGM